MKKFYFSLQMIEDFSLFYCRWWLNLIEGVKKFFFNLIFFSSRANNWNFFPIELISDFYLLPSTTHIMEEKCNNFHCFSFHYIRHTHSVTYLLENLFWLLNNKCFFHHCKMFCSRHFRWKGKQEYVDVFCTCTYVFQSHMWEDVDGN